MIVNIDETNEPFCIPEDDFEMARRSTRRRHVDVDEHLKLTSHRYTNIQVVIHYTKSDDGSVEWAHTHTR